MQRRGTIAIAVLSVAAILVGAALLLWDGGTAAQDTTLRVSVHTPEPADPLGAGGGGGMPAANTTTRIAVTPFTEAPEDDDALPGVESRPAVGIHVTVVHRDTREVVPGAEVMWIDFDLINGELLNKLGAQHRDPEEVLRRLSRRWHADAEGMAVVPYMRGAGWLGARAPGYFGVQQFSGEDDGPVTLEVGADEPLQIVVKNAAGEPVGGVPVDIAFGEKNRFPLARVASRRPDGTVTVNNMRAIGRLLNQEPHIVVGLGFPVTEPVNVAVDLESPPTEPVVLTVPAYGSVVVELVDDTGAIADGQGIVTLVSQGSVPTKPGEPEPYQPQPTAEMTGGHAKFDYVGLNLKLHARVMLTAGFFLQANGPGPTTDAEEAVLTMRRSAAGDAITGRLLDGESHPVPAVKVAARAFAKDGTRAVWERPVRTDSDGHFNVDLGYALAAGKGAKPSGPAWPAQLDFVVIRDNLPAMYARVDVPKATPGSATDLGDVTLSSGLLVASGDVVDEAGEPVHIARVRGTLLATKPGTKELLASDENIQTVTDVAGHFEMRARACDGSLRVQVTKTGYLADDGRSVACGTSGLHVVLKRAGGLEGNVVFDVGVPRDRIFISLRVWPPGVAAGAQPIWQQQVSPDGKGAFKFTGVPTGPATAVVGVDHGRRRNLEVVDGLVIAPGEPNRDPRLQHIDLRGRIRPVTLSIVDESGNGINNATVQVLPRPEAALGPFNLGGKGGSVLMLLPPEDCDARITAPGFRNAFMTSITTDDRVVLATPFMAEIRLSGSCGWPPRPYRLGMTLVAQGPKGGWGPLGRPEVTDAMGSEDRFFGSDGAARVRVTAPGRFAVRWVLRKPQGNGVRDLDFGSGRNQYIEVTGNGAVAQRFQVRPPNAADIERLRIAMDG